MDPPHPDPPQCQGGKLQSHFHRYVLVHRPHEEFGDGEPWCDALSKRHLAFRDPFWTVRRTGLSPENQVWMMH